MVRKGLRGRRGAAGADVAAAGDAGAAGAGAGKPQGEALGADGKACQNRDGDGGAECHGENGQYPAEQETVQQREGHDKQGAGTGAHADGDDGRPGIAQAEGAAAEKARVGQMGDPAFMADRAGRECVMIVGDGDSAKA